jgi:hypothetical protein
VNLMRFEVTDLGDQQLYMPFDDIDASLMPRLREIARGAVAKEGPCMSFSLTFDIEVRDLCLQSRFSILLTDWAEPKE